MTYVRETLEARVAVGASPRPLGPTYGNRIDLSRSDTLQSHTNSCRDCGTTIKLKRIASGNWLPCELSGERHVCCQRPLPQPSIGPVLPTPHLEPSDPLLECIDKQVEERKFSCVLCSAPVGSSIEKGGVFLRCTHCGRRHEISNETLNYTLERLKVRCSSCGGLAVSTRATGESTVGCCRYPQCGRTESWDRVRRVLRGGAPERPGNDLTLAVVSESRRRRPKRESAAALLQRRVDQIWEKVSSDRVQKHDFRVSVEIDDKLLDPILRVNILSTDVVPTSLSNGSRPVIFFGRNDDVASISDRLREWFGVPVLEASHSDDARGVTA